jgi:hypothetical protein
MPKAKNKDPQEDGIVGEPFADYDGITFEDSDEDLAPNPETNNGVQLAGVRAEGAGAEPRPASHQGRVNDAAKRAEAAKLMEKDLSERIKLQRREMHNLTFPLQEADRDDPTARMEKFIGAMYKREARQHGMYAQLKRLTNANQFAVQEDLGTKKIQSSMIIKSVLSFDVVPFEGTDYVAVLSPDWTEFIVFYVQGGVWSFDQLQDNADKALTVEQMVRKGRGIFEDVRDQLNSGGGTAVGGLPAGDWVNQYYH